MLSHLKPLVERCPTLAITYRTLRDTLTFQRQKPEATPYGFNLIGQAHMQAGTFEEEEVALVRHLLCEADVFVDVGANVGYYTCLARTSGKYTIAVEPLVQNLRYLYANLSENDWDNVEVWPVGLCRQPGIATLYGAGTGASLVSGWAGASPLLRQSIPVTTLDILLGGRFAGKRSIIKIDVEGAEYEVLQGAAETLVMSPRPIWLVEICLSEHYPTGLNPCFTKTFEMLWQYGYEARTADQNSRVVSPDDVERWVRERAYDFGSINYLFESKS